MRDFSLLLCIVFFALGVALGTFVAVSWAVLGIALVAAMIVLIFSRSATGVAVALCVIMGAAGVGRVMLVPAVPDAFLPLYGTKVSLVGTVVGDPDVRETTQRVTVAVAHEGQRTRLLAVLPLYPVLRHGEPVRMQGTLEHPKPFDTDGGRVFHYDRFLAKDGIFGIIQYGQVETLGTPHWWQRLRGALYAFKHAFISGLERALPEPYAALAAGLIAGGKQGLGAELLAAFTTAGLVHIVVLSGYNIMIIAEGVLKGLRILPRRMAATVAAGSIMLFVLAAGAGTASVRAGIMAGLGLFARASDRTYDAFRALLFVFALMILLNPYTLIYDPGFQFSFAATLGLILAATTLEAHLSWMRPAFLRDILATTLAAQLFVLPLLLYQTGNLSLIALPANLIALPLVPLAMLFGAIAGGAGMLLPSAAPIIGLPALALLWCITGVAQGAAALAFASVTVPTFSFLLVPVSYTLLALGLHALIRHMPAPKEAGMSIERKRL